MRLYFLLARRVPPVTSPVMGETWRILTGLGFAVATGIAEEAVDRPDRLVPHYDLYVLKSHTELSLSLAGALHVQGARILNPFPSCAATQNKIVASRLLRMAGVPTPQTWVTGEVDRLREVAAEHSLIIKPYLGHRGAGLHLVHGPDDLARLPPLESPILAQEFIPGPGEDLKVYVVGDQVAAVRKPFAPDSFTRPGRPVPVSPDVRDIALRCGQALGLGLYGLDVIEGPDGPVVVDLNTFPGYKGVPRAAEMIADYIARYARDAVQLTPPAPPPPDRLPEGAGAPG